MCPHIRPFFFLALWLSSGSQLKAQVNLLLNGGFEDVNTCTEYNAECGVEGWFYLKEVKAQMLLNEENNHLLGFNSFGIFSNWQGYTGFTPLIGTPLACGLQAGKSYTFKGLISARLHPALTLLPGICLGPFYYVPNRPFSKEMKPDSIVRLRAVPETSFFECSYHFTAKGDERYLTFGTYTLPDTTSGRKKLTGTQTVSLVLDNFMLVPDDPLEQWCPGFDSHKAVIYEYDARHRDMDHSLYGKGELDLELDRSEERFTTRILLPPAPLVPDTVKLGDVLFQFNKAILTPEALKVLSSTFNPAQPDPSIDSLVVEGHTDSIGSEQRNLELSAERCESVKQWLLLNHIVSSGQVRIQAYGKTRPIASNATPQGRALNRRVELIIFRKKEKN